LLLVGEKETIMSKTSPTLKLEQALQRMRSGARLVHMHGWASGPSWFVIPGGPVTDIVANKVREHPAVVAGADGMFPGHDQTWRMVNFII
jgi:hypothetical protein